MLGVAKAASVGGRSAPAYGRPLARPRPAKKFKEVRRTTLPDDMRRTPPDRGFPLEWPVQAEDDSWQILLAAFVLCERARVDGYRTPARILRSMS
jgi:hypothetical protein